jgi:hypothetical protein
MSPSYVKRLPGAIAPETSPTSPTYRARLQRALVSPADQIVPRH